ncbi:MAG TPA: M23 family metallopeptidase [Arachnia sp.]|nr:M23 family metallopeptidase [Arachnia sp.]HMT85172.1 M23 family metallopeptidase [Arachnia sp.]
MGQRHWRTVPLIRRFLAVVAVATATTGVGVLTFPQTGDALVAVPAVEEGAGLTSIAHLAADLTYDDLDDDTSTALSRSAAAPRISLPVAPAHASAPAGSRAPSPAPVVPPTPAPVESIAPIDTPKGSLLSKPVSGRQTSQFGMRLHPILGVWKLHSGLDWAAPCETPVGASADGEVVKVGWAGGNGNQVKIDHGKIAGYRVVTTYNHLSSFGVAVGQKVVTGQGVGRVGSTGYSTGCHLHFEVIVDGQFTNPLDWLNGNAVVVDLEGMLAYSPTPLPTPSPSPSPEPSPSPSPEPSPSPSPEPSPEPTVLPSDPTDSPEPDPSAPLISPDPASTDASSGEPVPPGEEPGAVVSPSSETGPSPELPSPSPDPSGSWLPGALLPSALLSGASPSPSPSIPLPGESPSPGESPTPSGADPLHAHVDADTSPSAEVAPSPTGSAR